MCIQVLGRGDGVLKRNIISVPMLPEGNSLSDTDKAFVIGQGINNLLNASDVNLNIDFFGVESMTAEFASEFICTIIDGYTTSVIGDRVALVKMNNTVSDRLCNALLEAEKLEELEKENQL